MSTWGSRLLWAGGTAAAAAGSIALAAVPPARRSVQQPVTISGRLTFAWHGDPARGCAVKGLCGERGSIVVSFNGSGVINGRGGGGQLSVYNASAIARVRRTDPGGAVGACVDANFTAGLGISLRLAARGSSTATVDAEPISAGRCAGPLSRDLRAVPIRARRLRGRLLGFDLRGATRFTAGPFSGELISSVVLSPDTRNGYSTSSTGAETSYAPPPPAPVRRIRVEYAQVTYGIFGATGRLTESFAGSPEPYCESLDACGSHGAVVVTVGGYRGRLTVIGTRQVGRPLSRSRALADLRAGRLGLDGTDLTGHPGVRIDELLGRADGGFCHDTIREPLTLLGDVLAPGVRRGGLPLTLIGPGPPADPLRTHCPGPGGDEILGGGSFSSPLPQGALAAGSLPPGELGAPELTVELARPASFTGEGYSGQRTGSLGFVLRRMSVRAGTRVERVSG